MELIVTDLTRFKNRDLLCMAALTFDGKKCVRPMRNDLPGYLRYEECKKYGILPGRVLVGEFSPIAGAEAPHVEDHFFSKMSVSRMATASEFYNVLSSSASTTLDAGFGLPILDKVVTDAPGRSIFTLKIPRVIALKCHLLSPVSSQPEADMPLKFTQRDNRSRSATYATIL